MSQYTTKSQRRKREVLYAMHPYCWWCGVLLDPAWWVWSRYAATIDHIFSRNTPERIKGAKSEPSVLACQECNHWRNDKEIRLRAVGGR